MGAPCRFTIWIDNDEDPTNPDPPLVINAGRSGDFVIRELVGNYQVAGTTAGRATQVVRGSQRYYSYSIQAMLSADDLSILKRIKNRQERQGPPINFRDEMERIDILEIDGFGSRQRLDAATFPDSLVARAGGAIPESHFESIGVLEVSDRLQARMGPPTEPYSSEVSFRVTETIAV